MALDFFLSTDEDSRPELQETFTQPNGSALNITGYTVTAKFRHQATGTVVSKSASLVTAASGICKVTFAPGDLADSALRPLAGGWDYQFKAVSSDLSVVVHIPNDGYKTLWATIQLEDFADNHEFYPTAADLWRFLEAHGLSVGADLKPLLSGAASAGVRDFERAAGRKMLANRLSTLVSTSADELRLFDPPDTANGILFLDDYVSLTSVGYQPLNSALETLVANEAYWAEPYGGPAKTPPIPYTQLKLRRQWTQPLSSALRQSLRVTARWGYGVTLPSDVFSAMLAGAGVRLWTQVTATLTGGRLSWKDDDVSEDFGIEPSKAQLSAWSEQVKQTASYYRRWTL